MLKLRFILILISCGISSLNGSQSIDIDSKYDPFILEERERKAPKNYKDFDKLYKDILGYKVRGWNLKEIKIYSDKEKMETLEKEGRIVSELISLSGESLSRFLQKDREDPEAHTPLEELYYDNLGHIAEQICNHFSKTTELPPEILLLRQIYHGQTVKITKDTYSEDFLKVAYRVANQVNNYPMVKELYLLSGVQKVLDQFKESSPAILSSEFNYIHEPYWIYNIVELKAYGARIIEKLRPYFISLEQVNETGKDTFITSQGEKIYVRKVDFGYVLPNFYLKKRLAHTNNFGVPRIFILPKDEMTNVTITFNMLYSKYKKHHIEVEDKGNNPLQVFCNDFEIYQEYIEGTGIVMDRSFSSVGHLDFNAVQVITSKFGKKYLVDTKEQKNFFMPYLFPLSDFDQSDVYLTGIIKAYGEKKMSQEKNIGEIFEKWKWSQQIIIFKVKSLNFDPRMMYVNVQVGLN